VGPAAQEALAFAQVNAVVANALRAFVLGEVLALSPRRVVDAYAGTGRLAAVLAEAGVDVVAIEADPAGAEASVARVRRAGPSVAGRVRVVCDLVERALPEAAGVSERPDVIVLNPPRRGVEAAVTRWLETEAGPSVRAVVYVSCDPGTLARDVSRLPSWRVDAVQCFDMFPQTAHVETVCVLRREGA
jgi:tRNA/tmRNA/rRNA uracil-C5-methylase (TrmA/RlmC/RlmD family)